MQTQTINWQPFSEKHKDYIHNALHNKMSVAEGAIRSGKTIDNCIIATAYLEKCKDKIHLASGSTIANAKLNIGVCNGFGLENLFRGRCRWGKFKDNEALFVNTKTGEKVVIFVGGGKADSYKRILGNSYGMWIATEVNEHYDSEDSRSSFIKVAFGRQVAAQNPLVLWDLNPCNPNHPIYDYIDGYQEGYVGGYQYEHFILADNLAITEERKREIESQYTVGSIWYRRDILGERCIAEGLCFPNYEDAVVDKIPDTEPDEVQISMDYGTYNALAAVLWERHGNVWYGVDELYYSGREQHVQKTDGDYLDMMEIFADKVIQKRRKKAKELYGDESYVERIKTVIDPSAASMITLLSHSKYFTPVQAINDVKDGINEVNLAIQRGILKIHKRCKHWVEEAGGYVWDINSVRDEPVKVRDHECDAVRYHVKTNDIVNKEYDYKSIFGG